MKYINIMTFLFLFFSLAGCSSTFDKNNLSERALHAAEFLEENGYELISYEGTKASS